MRLMIPAFDEPGGPRLAEGDPLPPGDRRAPRSSSALERLYRLHAPRLLRLFARRTGPDDAPDLVQEVFARFASVHRVAGDGIERPAAYLSRVATNLLRDRAKIAARRSADAHGAFEDDDVAGDDPHRLLEDRDALARLDAAVRRLNSRTRRIFLLQRVEGLSYAEIAGEEGMSVKGVKKQMAKALFQLRRDVGPL